MAYPIRTRDEHLASDETPKRILALDGGGLRGIVSVEFLARIEALLKRRFGSTDDFRLAHYFDLIAGTSTGAIIAAALALGWRVDEIRDKYLELGKSVFKGSLFRQGFFRAKYDAEKLSEELQSAFGEVSLGDAGLQTGLLIVTKRMDTGSPWPISNNPSGKYFDVRPGGTIGNADYPLWQVVRASTAAPSFFESEKIEISQSDDGEPIQMGEFVDGGVSPFNNPALQAMMYATMEGYRIGWPTGADQLLLCSVGTGAVDPSAKGSWLEAKDAIGALLALMDDSASLQETVLQWMSSSPTARNIDREVGTLENDLVAPSPLLTYQRYEVSLEAENVRRIEPNVDQKRVEDLGKMDAPENLDLLGRLGTHAAKEQVKEAHFPHCFDLA